MFTLFNCYTREDMAACSKTQVGGCCLCASDRKHKRVVSKFCQLLGYFWWDVMIIADMGCCVKCLAVSLESEYEDLTMLKVLNGLPSSFLT